MKKRFLSVALAFFLGVLGACGKTAAEVSDEDVVSGVQSEENSSLLTEENLETIYSCGNDVFTYIDYTIDKEEFDINDVEITVSFGHPYFGQSNPHKKEELDAGMIGNKVQVFLENVNLLVEDNVQDIYYSQGKSLAWFYEEAYEGKHQEYIQILKKIPLEDFYSYKYAMQMNEGLKVAGFNYSEKMKISPEIFTGEAGELWLAFTMLTYKTRVLESGERITTPLGAHGFYQIRYICYERQGDKIRLIPNDLVDIGYRGDSAEISKKLKEEWNTLV